MKDIFNFNQQCEPQPSFDSPPSSSNEPIPFHQLPHSSSELLPIRPEPILKQPESLPRPSLHPQTDLCPTSEHSVTIHQQILFEKLNAEYLHRFNQPLLLSEQKEELIHLRVKERKRFSQPDQCQHLKMIARHIHSILASNPNITVKTLSLMMFEIMTHTNIGLEIIESDYPVLSRQTLNYLNQRYKSDQAFSEKTQYVIKNTKRRLYDAVNVLLAASIIRKRVSTGGLNLAQNQRKREKEESLRMIEAEDKRYDFMELTAMLDKGRKRIEKKKALFQKLKEKTINVSHFLFNNRLNHEPNIDNKFKLPLLIVTNPSKMLVEIESQTVTIRSQQCFRLYHDIDCIILANYVNNFVRTVPSDPKKKAQRERKSQEVLVKVEHIN